MTSLVTHMHPELSRVIDYEINLAGPKKIKD